MENPLTNGSRDGERVALAVSGGELNNRRTTPMKRGLFVLCSITLALLTAQIFAVDRQPVRTDAAGDRRAVRANEPNAPGGPDFTNVKDILGGRRTLLPVDDLMISYMNENQTFFSISAFTSGGTIGGTNNSENCAFGNPPGNWAVGVGRMFNQPSAVELVVTAESYILIAQPNQNSCGNQQTFKNPVPGADPKAYNNQLTPGDFNGDGFTDFAVLMNGLAYPLTAGDVNNMDYILTGVAGEAADTGASFITLAAGDFDGNGDDELARISMTDSCLTCINVYIYDLQPVGDGSNNVKFVTAGQTQINLQNARGALVYAAAGTFSGATNPTNGIFYDQLLLGTEGIGLLTIQPTVQSTNPLSFDVSVADQTSTSSLGNSIVGLQSARLDFFAPTEQVVLGSFDDPDGGGDGTNYVAVLTFDPALNISIASTTSYKADILNFDLVQQTGIAVGNFDQATGPDTPLNLEIASLSLAFPDTDTPIAYMVPITVDAGNNFALTALSNASDFVKVTQLVDTPGGAAQGYIPRIVAGDLQGRSLLLGEPTKITVGHTQPRLVLGMPPMHVDWVKDASGSDPQVLNLSAVLGTFYSSYQTAVTDQAQSSSRSTTSWTHAVSATATEGYSWGGAATGSVKVEATQSAGYLHENQVAKQYDTYATTAFDVSATTGFDDQLWFNDERHNVYIYPIIGQTACPADKPDCSDAERLPLTLMISGPDQITQEDVTGSAQEWFQPVWEPGNVFSYPWNLTQLQAQYPSVNLLTSASPTKFFTDSSSLTEQAKWTEGSTSSTTTGTTNKISWGTSLSVSTTPPAATGGFSGSFSINYNGSKAMSTLNTATTVLGASTGIGINKPGTFPNYDQYQYGIQPFIFGDSPASGTFDTVNLGTDIQTDGILQAAFVADPTNAGSWWGNAYPLPDVALNHPVRWSVVTQTASTGPNCVETGNPGRPYSCATFNAPEADIWNSEFYWMKGLLITPAETAADGPQITQAKSGDQVRLQARVYNYSLTDMPAGSQVVAQFYGQPWNTGSNSPSGNSFLIENVTLGPIPGFNSQSNSGAVANWAVAETTKLDTAAHSDQHLVFWVLVVLKDAQGNPLAEMPGHGLTGVPPTVSGIAEAVTWAEPYSNNLGMYKSLFYIAPQNGQPNAPVGLGDLSIERVTVAPRRALLNEKVSVTAMLRAGDQALDGVSVKFYDGNPDAGGKLFDVERVSHIRANEAHQVRVPLRPATCGRHTLYVKTHPQAQVSTATLRVRIKPLPVVRELTRQTLALEVPARDKRYLLNLLREARQSFRRLDVGGAMSKLDAYREKIAGMRGGTIPVAQADAILAQLDLLRSCVGLDMEMTKQELMEDQGQ